MKTKILVTGSNGQLGQTIKALYANYSKAYEFTFLSKSDLDISNESEVFEMFKVNDYNYCINCAAYTNVEQAEKTPEIAFSVNAEAVKHIASACKTHNTTLIHISTDYVFDGEKKTPYSIEDTTNPINEYGKSKLQGELYIKEICKKYFIIRTSWLYSKYNNNFVKTIVNKLETNSNLQITTTQTGTPTSCIDLSNFIYFLINNSIEYGIYNFSALGETNWYEFAKHIALGFKSQTTSVIQPTTSFASEAKRPSYSVLDMTKTQQTSYKIDHWKTSVNVILKHLETSK